MENRDWLPPFAMLVGSRCENVVQPVGRTERPRTSGGDNNQPGCVLKDEIGAWIR
jgi:hypothetical protein